MNLIVIPLEGVSQLLFGGCADVAPTLWRLYVESFSFRRFYTASTSSFSSFCDLNYGDSTRLDDFVSYSFSPGCLAGRAEGLFDTLAANGFAVKGLMHGNPCPDYAKNNFWGAWPEKSEGFEVFDAYAPFHAAAEAFLDGVAGQGQPFALYYCDRATRLDDMSPEKDSAANLAERFEAGLSLVNDSVEKLMIKLSALGLLGDTTIAVTGLYGVDPWKHGFNQGRVYGVEPYADSAWTPMFLYMNGNNVGMADQLVTTIDMKPTLLSILLPGLAQPQAEAITQGVNFQELTRYYAFTQNLFALERGHRGAAEGLAKSYGVTDGDQRLIVSLDPPANGGGGMELYYDARDPANTRNFLDFLHIDESGDVGALVFKGIRHSHFIMALNPGKMFSVIFSYNRMRGLLQKYVQEKEAQALGRIRQGGGNQQFPTYVFRRKRRRQ